MIPFDIETKPRADLVARFVKPYPAFNPDEVKYGNTKDPAKRAELLAVKEADHKAGEAVYWANAKERASLNPLTAEIVCIGLLIEGEMIVLDGDERTLLEKFWKEFTDFSVSAESFVFWSGNGSSTENFDADFIIRRSWILGVAVPASAFSERYLGRRFVDAAARWLLGKREAFCSLSDAADQLGLFGVEGLNVCPKSDSDPVQGVNFWQWYEGTFASTDLSPDEQRECALRYLHNDLRLLQAIVGRLYGPSLAQATA